MDWKISDGMSTEQIAEHYVFAFICDDKTENKEKERWLRDFADYLVNVANIFSGKVNHVTPTQMVESIKNDLDSHAI